jgi:hypothetical protein
MTTTQVPARAQRLYALWEQLPTTPLDEGELEHVILRTLDGSGREADASGLSYLLVSSGAVIAVGDEAGRVTYTKADEFPEHPENGIGSDVHNAYLADRSREE